jgi:FlaA1/EpsC-like NDP-sugar epimerase
VTRPGERRSRSASSPAAAPGASSDVGALLGRPEITVDLGPVDDALAGSVVLVTGAAGSIGGEISRCVADRKPRVLLVLDRGESPLHRLEQELRETTPGLDVVPVLVDVLDRPAVETIFTRFRPAFVFHAAAYKHVPMLERHPAQGVRNNVGGTRVVAEAALAAGAQRFVFISTDKAMRPSSVMGASKRVCEMLLQCLASESAGGTTFVTVRFGNVLDSHGNVVEQFARQIATGGPVTVTHPAMTRYFMTAAEAARLVLQASIIGGNGDVILLDIDRPQKVLDLAHRMIRLGSPGAGRDVHVEIVGARPGEKLQEDYRLPGLHLEPTDSPFVLKAALPPVDPAALRAAIEALLLLAELPADEPVVRQLHDIVPDYERPPPS